MRVVASGEGEGARGPGVPRGLDALLVCLLLASAMPGVLAELQSDLALRGQGLGFLALAGMTGVASVTVARSSRPGFWRVSLTRLVVLSAIGYVVWEVGIARAVPVIALGHFVLALGAAKLLDLRGRRDRLVVVVIALLLTVIGAMVSAHVVFAAVVAAYLTVGVYWLIRFRLTSEAATAWERAAAVAGVGVRRGVAARSAWGTVTACGVAMGLGAAGTFLLAPRGLQSRRFEISVPPSMTGFTTSVSLSEIGPIVSSEQMVMRVRLRRGGRVVGGAEEALYLRGVTLDRYTSGRWLERPTGGPRARDVDLGAHDGMTRLSRWIEEIPPEELLEQEVWIESVDPDAPYLFTVYPVGGVSSPDVTHVDFNVSDRSLRLPRVPRGDVYYKAVSAWKVDWELAELLDAEAYPVSGRPRSVTARVGRYARHADGPSRTDASGAVRTLARRVAGVGEDIGVIPVEQHESAAEAIESYLRSGEFRYTTDVRDGVGGGGPIERFLLERRSGSCAHFASAMTVMCQTLGIGARLVVGYLGQEYNDAGQFYRIRKRDAHAWVEVDVPGRGWVVYDPTPLVRGRAGGSAGGWLGRVEQWYEMMQFEWASLVVSFDAEHRRELWGLVWRWWETLAGGGRGPQGWRARVVEILWGPGVFTWTQRVMYWVCMGLLVTLGVLVARAGWVMVGMARDWAGQRRGSRGVKRRAEAKFYDVLLSLMSRQGIEKPAAMTPREFARAVAGRRPELSGVVRLTEQFYELQYGGRELSRQVRREVREALEALRIHGRLGA